MANVSVSRRLLKRDREILLGSCTDIHWGKNKRPISAYKESTTLPPTGLPPMSVSLAPFSDLPDDARLWIHPATDPLSDSTQTALLDHLSAFIDGWTSHQHAVQGAATVLHDRFLMLAAVRADGGDISGCGIDAAAHAIDEAATRLDIDWVPSLHVIYRTNDGSVAAVPRPTFQKQVDAGTVTTDTKVFDPSLTTLEALRNGDFEQPAGESWHGRLFSLPAAA